MTPQPLSSAAKSPRVANNGAGDGAAHSEDAMNAQAAAAEQTNIIVAVNDNPGLVLLDQQRFNQFYEAIKQETDRLVPDLTTERGRKEIASMAFKVTKTKTAIDDAGKLLKEEAQKTVNLVDAARREIKGRLEALSKEVRRPLTEWEDAEKARVENCEATIRHIEECGRGFIGGETYPYIILLRELEEKVAIDDTFREYRPEAIRARDAALERIRSAMERDRQAEADRAELERLRSEAAEREEKARLEAEAKAAAEAAERAKQEAEERAARAAGEEKARIEAAAKAAEDAARAQAEAAARAEREAADRAHAEALAAEKRRADEADAARKAEADRIARETAAREAEEKAAADAAAARAADIEHRSKIMGAAKQAIMGHGVGEAAAKAIVLAVAAGDVPNISIRF